VSSTTTQTSICNRALQLVGYQSISSINDNSRGARAMNRAYQPVLLNTLRSNFWSFAITRAILPASSTTPAFGPSNYFPLPGDFVMLAMPDQVTNYAFGAQPGVPYTNTGCNDWQIESFNGQTAITSSQPSPLYIRYVTSNVTEANFDASFAEAFSANLAMETCEELTQSNTKLTDISKIYDTAIDNAKKRNAFENNPVRPPIDPYILCRF
jgi:hypothetical protein